MASTAIPGTHIFDGAAARKGYALNKMCFSFNDAANRAAFLTDEEGYMRRYGLSDEQAAAIRTDPAVRDYQIYAGTAAPMNFNGLVRQYYLRQLPWQGDVQVNLQDRHQRDEQSHAIALRVRPLLSKLEQTTGASIKLVEVPPGPPVMAPLVAEVYGPDYQAQLKAATQLQQQFAATPLLVDIDSTGGFISTGAVTATGGDASLTAAGASSGTLSSWAAANASLVGAANANAGAGISDALGKMDLFNKSSRATTNSRGGGQRHRDTGNAAGKSASAASDKPGTDWVTMPSA